MTTQYWLVKSEPDSYSWADFARDKKTAWTGVRNFAARLHLNAMRPGDRVLFYESVTTKAVVGVAEGAVQPISDSANTKAARTTVVRMRRSPSVVRCGGRTCGSGVSGLRPRCRAG